MDALHDAIAANSHYKQIDIDAEWVKRSVPMPINGKIILAFLQNPWFPPKTNPRSIDLYKSSMAFRRTVLSMSKTGKWLTRTLGPDLYWKIWWDNASPIHGETYDHKSPADGNHMVDVVKKVCPNIVILFGRQACKGWDHVQMNWPKQLSIPLVLSSAHPMARGNQIPALEELAKRLREEIA